MKTADYALPALMALVVVVMIMLVFDDLIVFRVELRSLNKLAPSCQAAPVTVDEQEVRQYRGTVVASPSVLGKYGRKEPDDTPGGEVVFVVEDGATVPLMLLLFRQVEPPAPGARLQFCAALDNQGYWWPQTGYQASGWGQGPILGEPIGPYPIAKWIMDTGS